MNSFALSGRIGNELELVTSKSGKHVVRFSLYVRGRGNRQAEDFRDYRFDIVAYDEHADNLCRYKKKGDWVCVQGYCYQNVYENYKKDTINTVQFVVNEVDYGPPPPGQGRKKGGGKADSSSPFTEEDGEDDLPF